MAVLTNCPTCQGEVSSAARACPKCGHVLRRPGRVLRGIGLAMTFGGIFAMCISPHFFVVTLFGLLIFAAGRAVAG